MYNSLCLQNNRALVQQAVVEEHAWGLLLQV